MALQIIDHIIVVDSVSTCAREAPRRVDHSIYKLLMVHVEAAVHSSYEHSLLANGFVPGTWKAQTLHAPLRAAISRAGQKVRVVWTVERAAAGAEGSGLDGIGEVTAQLFKHQACVCALGHSKASHARVA